MKKIILLLAVVITCQLSAQEKVAEPAKEAARVLEQKNTISVGLISSEPSVVKIVWERKHVALNLKRNYSSIYEIGNGGVTVNLSNGKSVFGSGIVLGWGSKTYLKKEQWKGFYYQNTTEYGSIKFSDANYTGSYSYLALFNPDLGFKWQVSKGFSIDPSIGCMLKIQFKGTGDVDNKIFTNFVPKIGLKIGYSF